jgi:outer membrane lipoprotein carrier protein
MQNKAFKVSFIQTTQKSQSNADNQNSKMTLKQKIKKGQLTFLAPNRFIWQYNFPEQEIIQSDGETVTLWNKSINQIIQKQAKTILQNSPIELIFNGAWKQQFDIELDINPKKDTINISSDKIDATIILKPKQSDAMYASIYLHFYQQQLKVLSFNTRAGFKSHFEFTEFKAHALKANDFKFKQELLEQIEAKS